MQNDFLTMLAEIEDLAEKKAKIYSRLLTEPALAQEMDALSARHQTRKNAVLSLKENRGETGAEDEQ